MSDISITVDHNVNIKCIDSKGKVVRNSSIHNKATYHMVEGLLRFLRGDFTPSEYNNGEMFYNTQEAYQYIPSKIRFGTVGVKMKDRMEDKPRLSAINYSEMKTPSFDEYKLQQEIRLPRRNLGIPEIKFESASFSSFDNPNSSMALLLHAFVPSGGLVGVNDGDTRKYFTDKFFYEECQKGNDLYYNGRGWTYWQPRDDLGLDKDGEYEAIFTEIGLLSGSGDLLARVLLDGKLEVKDDGTIVYEDSYNELNPVIQSDSTSIVIEWKIGLVSIGQNDSIISAADLRNLGITIETGEEGLLVEKERIISDLKEIINKLYEIDEVKYLEESQSELIEELDYVNSRLYEKDLELEDSTRHLRSERERLINSLEDINNSLYAFEGLSFLKEEKERLEKELQSIQSLIDNDDPEIIESKIAELQLKVDRITEEQSNLGLEYSNEEKERLEKELSSINERLSGDESDLDIIKALNNEKDRLEEQIEEVTSSINNLTERYNNLEKQKSVFIDKINSLNERLAEINEAEGS